MESTGGKTTRRREMRDAETRSDAVRERIRELIDNEE